MMTAFTVETLIKDALKEGAFGILKKPINFDILFDLIESSSTNGDLIMIVDDNEETCKTMQSILIKKGYSVNIAIDRDSAIEKSQAKDFNVIILDIKLPTINDLETYLTIREFRPHVIVIIISGSLDKINELNNTILSKSANICLEKPLKIEKLTKTIDEILKNN